MLATSEKDKLLMIPGPTPVKWEILAALGEPTISHTGPEMAGIMTRTLDLLRWLMGNERGHVFAFAGSGTLAQEAAVVNTVEPGGKLLVASNGLFGDRFVPIAKAHGIEVTRVGARWGTSVTAEDLAAALDRERYDAVAVTHVETSTGVMAPLTSLLPVAQARGVLCIVDGVCALGGVPESMAELGIDILLSGTQKALGVPPGLTILGTSPAAWQRREARTKPVNAYYADLGNWLPAMEDPRTYFSTHAVNMIYALRAGLEIIAAEGLEERYARHCFLASTFRRQMAGLGFFPVTDADYLAPTLSVLKVPEGVGAADLRRLLSDRGVIVAAGLGELTDSALRFAHMGNISDVEMAQTLSAVEAALNDIRHAA